MADIRVTLVETGQQMEAKLLVNRSNNKKLLLNLLLQQKKQATLVSIYMLFLIHQL